MCNDWKWNIVNPRSLNRSSTRFSLWSITFPQLHQWYERLYTIMLSNISLEVLGKQMNKNLLNLSYWLRANKLCLNMQKTELIIFRPTSLRIDPSIKFKPQGKRSNVKIKLNRTFGILSKLRHNSSLDILKITSLILCFIFAICMSALGSKESNITKPNLNTSK